MKSSRENDNFRGDQNPMYMAYQSAGILMLLLVLAAVVSVEPAVSLPQFAMINGEKCIACHVNALGSGLRTTRGFYEMHEAGLLKPGKVGLGSIYRHDRETNQFLGDRFSFGTDMRYQTTRTPKSSDAKRRYFPMQFSMYSTFKVSPCLKAEGSYNFGPKKFLGQQKWTGSLILQPENSYTQLRAGYFQPSIGIRYDDHTIITRQTAGANGSSLIPPSYAEYGAEFNYNGMDWLTVTTGVFGARSLAENRILDRTGKEISLITDRNNPSFLGRLEFRHRAMDRNVNLLAGSSVLVNGDFNLISIFASAGLAKRVSLISEYARSDKKGMRRTHNGVVDVSCRVTKPLLLYVRGERGISRFSPDISAAEVYTNRVVFGAQIFPIPYVELRPEYRLVDTEQYKSSRYAVQLHLFY
ncbi:MAG: hypothetical protein Q8O92_16065 [Candidatus Latescibacter sp.]|nr:hypothetical protein [Candidatus Latescibacter sp.]